MKLKRSLFILCFVSLIPSFSFSQIEGVYRIDDYMYLLEENNVGLVVNHSSKIQNTHLIDTLVSSGVNVSCIFSPEHGFSGNFDPGEHFSDSLYNESIPIYSLYTNKHLKDVYIEDVDVIIFDIQDVGVRFYTYISTLHYVMEGCAENDIKLIVLDRPNPHAHYVDGPVLDINYASFVGMHPVPIVYGMTIGEYALMINGEGWLKNNLKCDLKIIKNFEYSRSSIVPTLSYPSPNLLNMNAIFLYPSLCLFEGTSISVGRGTKTPFEIYGAPFLKTDFSFIPIPNFGSKNPKYNNEVCFGFDLRNKYDTVSFLNTHTIDINYLITAFENTPLEQKPYFFNSFFNRLAGSPILENQILDGLSEEEIRQSWESDIKDFLLIRDKYLIYN